MVFMIRPERLQKEESWAVTISYHGVRSKSIIVLILHEGKLETFFFLLHFSFTLFSSILNFYLSLSFLFSFLSLTFYQFALVFIFLLKKGKENILISYRTPWGFLNSPRNQVICSFRFCFTVLPLQAYGDNFLMLKCLTDKRLNRFLQA